MGACKLTKKDILKGAKFVDGVDCGNTEELIELVGDGVILNKKGFEPFYDELLYAEHTETLGCNCHYIILNRKDKGCGPEHCPAEWCADGYKPLLKITIEALNILRG